MMLIPLLSVAILMASLSPITSLTIPTGDATSGSTDGAVAHPKQSVESAASVKVFNAPDSTAGAAVEISKSHGGPAVGYGDNHRPSQHHNTKVPQSKPEHHSGQHHEPSFSDALSHMSQAFRLGLCNKFGWCMPFPKDNHPASTSPIGFPSTAHFETEYDKDAFLGMGSSSSHGKNPFGMISSVFHGWHDEHDSSSVHGSKPHGSHRIPHQINKPGHHHDGDKHQIGDDYHGSHGHHQSTHKPDHGNHDHHQSHADTHHKPHEPHGVAAFLQSLVKPSGPLKPTPIHEEHHHGESHQGSHHGNDSPGSGLYFTDADHSSNPHSDNHPETSMHGSAHGATHHGELSFGNHNHGTTGHHEKPHGSGSHASSHHYGSNYPHHHLSGGSHGVHPQSSNTGHHTHQPESSVHGHHDSNKGHHAGGHHSSSPHKDEHHVSAANPHYKPHFNVHPGGEHAAVKPNKHHPYMTTTHKPLFGPLRLPWSVKKFLLV